MVTIGRFVLVRPSDGDVQAAFARAKGAAGGLAGTPGMLDARAWFGFPFRDDVPAGTPPDLQLVAVSAVGTDPDALAGAWPQVTASLEGAERLEVEGEVVRAAGTGWGGPVPVDGVLELDEPVLVVITGDVRPEHLLDFVEAGRPVITQAKADPDYLGGCGLVTEKMLDITSFSYWRTARAARRFGFGQGAHRTAKDADAAGGWHDMTTNVYLTMRVRSSTGTLLGADPFAAAR